MSQMDLSLSILIVSPDPEYTESLVDEIRAGDGEAIIETPLFPHDPICERFLQDADLLVLDCAVLREPKVVFKDYLRGCVDIPCIALVHSDDIINLPLVLEHEIETYLNKSRPQSELAKMIVRRASSLVDLRQIEETRCRTERRLHVLVELAQTPEPSFTEIADYMLEKMVELSDSEMGYLAFLEADGRMLRMHAWSGKGLPSSRMPCKPILYNMDEVGVWGEPIRQRKPIILNDFAAGSPLKKGFPTGHMQIDRFMAIPIYHNGTIVATAGVANKAAPYRESDVVQVGLLMDGMIAIQSSIEMRQEIVESQGKYQALLDSLPFTVVVLDEHSRVISINKPLPGSVLDPDEIVGLRLADRQSDVGKQYNAIFQKTVKENALIRQEVLLELEHGQTIYLDAAISRCRLTTAVTDCISPPSAISRTLAKP